MQMQDAEINGNNDKSTGLRSLPASNSNHLSKMKIWCRTNREQHPTCYISQNKLVRRRQQAYGAGFLLSAPSTYAALIMVNIVEAIADIYLQQFCHSPDDIITS